jgi:hypothetical protein
MVAYQFKKKEFFGISIIYLPLTEISLLVGKSKHSLNKNSFDATFFSEQITSGNCVSID